MKLKDIFATASANMFRSKLRTTLTILAIFIGAFTLTLTNGIGLGVSSYINNQIGSLGQEDVINISVMSTEPAAESADNPVKYNPDSTSSSTSFSGPSGGGVLTEKDIAKLKADKDLTNVQAMRMIAPDYIQGANGEKYKVHASPIASGTKLDLAAGQQLSSSSAGNQIILPVGYVDPLGYSSANQAIGHSVTMAVTDAFGKQHTTNATIVGIQQKGIISSSGAALSQSLSNTLYDFQTTGLPAATKNKFIAATAHIVGSTDASHVAQIKVSLSKQGYKGQTAADVLGVFNTVISAITGILNGFAIIALLAASFGIVNTLLMSVQERTKEIGLMKAMGMRSSRIFLLFSSEAILIGFWGSAIGVVVAMGVGTVINKWLANGPLKDLPGFNLLAFSAMSTAGTILLIMLIAFLAGTLPARKAAKQNPIDALRYE